MTMKYEKGILHSMLKGNFHFFQLNSQKGSTLRICIVEMEFHIFSSPVRTVFENGLQFWIVIFTNRPEVEWEG